MKESNNNIWVGLGDKNQEPEFLESQGSEFTELPIIDALSKPESENLSSNRRDFLKYLGFGLGAATMAAGCEAPVRRAIPYVTKPDEIVPGVATYYASTFVRGGDYCPVLVKTREGRPIKVEGNALSGITGGGTSARVQASVLSLYDTNRLRSGGTISEGVLTSMGWGDLDKAIKGKLNASSQIRIVSNTILSPTLKRAFADFKAKYPNAEWVTYDPVSCSAILQANEACFGQKAIPAYHFDKANIIVSVGADFLGTWISPIEYARQYTKNRTISTAKGAKMSRHIQVESGMSLTGSNADNRILIRPSEQGSSIAALYNAVAAKAGASSVSAPALNDKAAAAIKATANELWSAKGHALVVSGSNNYGEQILVNNINELLGSYGATIDFSEASMQRQGVDADVQNLIAEMNNGGVDALFVYEANPSYDLPNGKAFSDGMAKVGMKVSLGGQINETSWLCDYAAPDHHYLESWGDAEAKKGHYSLIQPTIAPLFKTRQIGESLLVWADSPALDRNAEQPYYEYLKSSWRAMFPPETSGYASFTNFWDSALHDGILHSGQAAWAPTACAVSASSAIGRINKPSSAAYEISFFETVNIGAGEYAGNPWLQEMPDPITRCVWSNYLTVPVEVNGNNMDGVNGIGRLNSKSTADFVDITINGGGAIRVTAIPQFGQMPGTMSIGLGYGREIVGECGKRVGVNVNSGLQFDANKNVQYYSGDATLSGIAAYEEEFACVQYHHTMGLTSAENRDLNIDEEALAYQGSLTERTVIRQTNLGNVEAFVKGLKEERAAAQKLNSHTLYPADQYQENIYSQGHHWGMHVDLNACIGCGACSIACMAENNVPVVGKREVHRHHEMSWLRIDRYFYGDVHSPNVVYQPLMCQHCDNAPCENVCPVAATNHSSEGLNQMTYNRCIGTRYCANNCPFKVRRFNWLDYTTADLFPGNQPHLNEEGIPFGADNLTRMVLNPDVTVRSRGVIEKCSFCVQRIQEGKLTAKKEGRRLRDGDVRTACQTSCPTGAITFGDINDKNSAVNKKRNNDLAYRMLEEVNVQPSVVYSAKVNNKNEKLDA